MRFTRSYSPLASAPYSTSSSLHVPSPISALQRTALCISQIWREAGIKGFYRGLSASYLGVSEGVIQWTLYEQFKMLAARRKAKSTQDDSFGSKGMAAGAAKFIATIITYPHEVSPSGPKFVVALQYRSHLQLLGRPDALKAKGAGRAVTSLHRSVADLQSRLARRGRPCPLQRFKSSSSCKLCHLKKRSLLMGNFPSG